MKLTIPALNALMQKLEAQPTLTSTTPGPKCGECGLPYLVTWGRRSKAWIVMHTALGPIAATCSNRFYLAKRDTQSEAIALAQKLEGEA